MNFFKNSSSEKEGNVSSHASLPPISALSTISSASSSSVVDRSWRCLINQHDKQRESILRALALTINRVALADFATNEYGLDDGEVASRLAVAGPNKLSSSKATPWWMLLLHSVANRFNLLLVIIAITAAATPPPSWSVFTTIMLMILLSVAVRFWQEYRSAEAAIKVQATIKTDISVHRIDQHQKPQILKIDRSGLVPGDIVSLAAGDNVPADCLLLESTQLNISQSALTGESYTVEKLARKENDDERQIRTANKKEVVYNIPNLVLMGTEVVSGHALGLVVATGDNGYIASVPRELNNTKVRNAFAVGIDRVTYVVFAVMLVMIIIVLVVRGEKSKNWRESALFSLSVAIGVVPEMLPAVLSINLARSAYLLAKKQAIVKRLESVQNLGCVNVLCSDKTGTLTKDEITLHNTEDCEGQGSPYCLRLAYTNAVYQSGRVSNIDVAIINSVDEKVRVVGEKVKEIPFVSEQRRMSVVVRDGGELMLVSKGAFAEILSICSRIRMNQGVVQMHTSHREMLKERLQNHDGKSALAIATNAVHEKDVSSDSTENMERGAIFEGFLLFSDPVKDDAQKSVAALQKLNVQIKVLTGDSLTVAMSVCQSLGLQGPDPELLHNIRGRELEGLDAREFREEVLRCSIFAQVSTKQKADIIKCLKAEGMTVGMLGDGINDCVALRAADAGITVNTAVDIAKECAHIILTERNLCIVVDGVKLGRATHCNTMKYIKTVIATGLGSVISYIIASAWLPYQPLEPAQLIVQTLLFNICQVTLPWDSVDSDYLAKPPAWNTWDLFRFVMVIGPTRTLIDVSTFLLNWFFYGIRTVDSPLVGQAQAHFFLQGLFINALIVHLTRTAKIPFVQSRASIELSVATLAVVLLGVGVAFIPPIANSIGLQQAAGTFIGFLAMLLTVFCIEVQAVKMMYIRFFNMWL